MKTIVVYKSSTGFTKRYAEWIAEEIGCDVITSKEALKNPGNLQQYDQVIYGGWIMANMVAGLNKIIDLVKDKLIVFGVGGNEDSEQVRNCIVTQNHIENIPFYYFEGGIDYKKLKLGYKIILKAVKKDEYGNSFDHANKNSIKPLIDFINNKNS